MVRRRKVASEKDSEIQPSSSNLTNLQLTSFLDHSVAVFQDVYQEKMACMTREKQELEHNIKETLHTIDKLDVDADRLLRMLIRQREELKELKIKNEHFMDYIQSQQAENNDSTVMKAVQSGTRSSRLPKLPTHSPQLKFVFGNGKIFRPRESRLSELLLVTEFQTIYHIFVAVLILLGITLVIQNYATKGVFVDFTLFSYTFGHLDVAFRAWIVMFCFSSLGYLWSHSYKILPFYLNVVLYTVRRFSMFKNEMYQLALTLFAALTTLYFALPPGSGLIVMCEQTRFSMKLHSFFRAYMKGPPSSREKIAFPDREIGFPSGGFQHFMYFLFCPTLLYRTSYPRTPYVRWSKVVLHSLECIFIVFYFYIVFEHYLLPIVQSAGSTDLLGLVQSIMNSTLPSVLVFVFGFFGFLHCWLNLWGELLQFADREFYKDWWNSHNFAEYYRKWNGVVYDWLHTYVYVDLVNVLESRHFSKTVAKGLSALFVIEFSALIHEYILACVLGHWFPILWFTYGGIGLSFNYLNRANRKGADTNIFIWVMLVFGCGFMMTLYSGEYIMRQSKIDHSLTIFDSAYWTQFTTSYSFTNYVGRILG